LTSLAGQGSAAAGGSPAGQGAFAVDGSGAAAGSPSPLPSPPAGESLRAGAGVQVLNAYLLLEVPEGLLLFDQHALHEKVLYERILEQLRAGAVPRQKLLIPEVVELPVDLAPLVEEAAERLGPLGFEVERFGPREAAVQSIPSVLGDDPAGPVVLETLRGLRDGGAAGGAGGGGGAGGMGERDGGDPLGAELRELAQMLACKRAVKAGAPLAPEEIRSLLEAGASAVDPRYCPHGRPTGVLITASELERRFQRR